jgi:hypothetical protein
MSQLPFLQERDTVLTVSVYRTIGIRSKLGMLYCDTVIPRIEQEIIHCNLPEALTRYEAGEMLNFNTILVSSSPESADTSTRYFLEPVYKGDDEEVSWRDVVGFHSSHFPYLSQRYIVLKKYASGSNEEFLV